MIADINVTFLLFSVEKAATADVTSKRYPKRKQHPKKYPQRTAEETSDLSESEDEDVTDFEDISNAFSKLTVFFNISYPAIVIYIANKFCFS